MTATPVDQPMRSTVITVTFNSAREIREFWAGFQPAHFEWIVVDNASTDDSAAIAADLGARVVKLPRNVGFSAANNVGAALASGDVLLFANPDIEVPAAELPRLARAVHAEGGIRAPQLVNEDGSLQENGRGSPFPWRKVAHMFRPRGPMSQAYGRRASPGEVVDVAWVMGAAVAIRADEFRQLGGWDSGFFIYYEDSDLGIRALRAGMTVRVDGSLNWRHGWARATRGPFRLGPWIHEVRSAARFYLKHPYCVVPVGPVARLIARTDTSSAPASVMIP